MAPRRAMLGTVKDEALKLAVANAESITQWALLILGGTVAILVGSEFRRPKSKHVRWWYWLFLVGWGCLVRSMYLGTVVSRAFIGHLAGTSDNATVTRLLNENWYSQIWWFDCAIGAFGVWLVVYLWWWINHDERATEA